MFYVLLELSSGISDTYFSSPVICELQSGDLVGYDMLGCTGLNRIWLVWVGLGWFEFGGKLV